MSDTWMLFTDTAWAEGRKEGIKTGRSIEYARIHTALTSDEAVDTMAKQIFHDFILDNPHMADWEDMMNGEAPEQLEDVRRMAREYLKISLSITDEQTE